MKKYDSYKDSGVEWIGEIPDNWKVCSFRNVINSICNGSSDTQIEDETGYKVTRIETISSGEIDYSKTGNVKYHKGLEKYRLKIGDLLLSNINSLAMVGNCAKYDGKHELYSGMNLLRICPNEDLDKDWFYYLVRSYYFNQSIKSVCKPAINQVSVPTSKIKEIQIVVPSYNEQVDIASYLDKKTSEIDNLISSKEELIETLKKYRQSLITEVVTKGIDPNVKMKDSGVEWIGEIPEHWKKVSLKHLADKERYSFTDGPFGSDLKNEEYQDEGVPLIQLNNIKDGNHLLNKLNFISEEKSQDLLKHTIYPGDLVVAKMAHPVARTAIVSDAYPKYNIVADCIRLKPDKNKCSVEFLNYTMNSNYFKSQAETVSTGTTRLRINLGTLKSLQIALPPLKEQEEIYKYLDIKTYEVDTLVNDIKNQIQTLKKYSQSLIFEAVTGKIDIR